MGTAAFRAKTTGTKQLSKVLLRKHPVEKVSQNSFGQTNRTCEV